MTASVDDEAGVSAQLRALIGTGQCGAQLESLYREALTRLGPGHPVTLLIRCNANHYLDPIRPVDESLADWAELRDCAAARLPEHHPTLLTIRSHYARCLGRRGSPGDLDLAVELCRSEVDRRIDGEAGENLTGVARLDLAAALLDRGRSGRFDPALRRHRPGEDITEARHLVDRELARRTTAHGSAHPSTWHVHAIRGEVLLARSGRAEPAQRRRLGAEALSLAEILAEDEWRRSNSHTFRALRTQLLRAESLTVLGQDRKAESEARLAAVLARRYPGPAAGHALLLLARALIGRDRPAALAAATAALTARRALFPPGGRHVAEAEHLVGAVSGAR